MSHPPRDPNNEPTRSQVGLATEPSGPRVLVFWDGGFTTRDLADGTTLVIGRAAECDVHVVHPSVSRRHVALHAGRPMRVEDLGSANGTRIGGVVMKPHTPVVVEPGDVIEAGSAMVVVQWPREVGHDAVTTAVALPTVPRLERRTC